MHTDLLNRYLRNYCKSVFNKIKEKKHIDTINVIQIIAFTSNSDECVQSVVTALELVTRLG